MPFYLVKGEFYKNLNISLFIPHNFDALSRSFKNQIFILQVSDNAGLPSGLVVNPLLPSFYSGVFKVTSGAQVVLIRLHFSPAVIFYLLMMVFMFCLGKFKTLQIGGLQRFIFL